MFAAAIRPQQYDEFSRTSFCLGKSKMKTENLYLPSFLLFFRFVLESRYIKSTLMYNSHSTISLYFLILYFLKYRRNEIVKTKARAKNVKEGARDYKKYLQTHIHVQNTSLASLRSHSKRSEIFSIFSKRRIKNA